MKYFFINDLISDKISGEWGLEPTSSKCVNVIRSTNFTNEGKINFSNTVQREISESKVNRKKLQNGDIIIEKSGGSPNQAVGRVVFFENTNDQTFLCNNFTSILRPSDQVFSKYLFYNLFLLHLEGKTLSYQNKTTGILNLQLDRYIKTEKIPLPSLEEQKRIVKILDTAAALRQKRKLAITLLDDYIKSVFLDMFGDPISNPKGWGKTFISNIAEVKGRVGWKGYKRTDLRDSGPYVLGATHLSTNGSLDLSDPVFISKEKYNESPDIAVHYGDLLIVQRGNTIGKVSIVDADIGAATINPCILILRVIDANVYFLKQYLMNEKVLKQLWKLNAASAQPMLTQKDIRGFKLFNPPILLQNEFAQIVKKVDFIRKSMRTQSVELDTQFQCLLKKTFRGEK